MTHGRSLIERLEARYSSNALTTAPKDALPKIEVVAVSSVPPPINPDGPEAAALIRELVQALGECQDKLWVIHFGLKDAAEREAAINACNMATKAFGRAKASQ